MPGRRGARSADTGLDDIRDLVAGPESPLPTSLGARFGRRTCSATTPTTSSRLAPVTGRRLKVVVDAGNGMAGHTAPAVLGRLDLDVVADVLRARRHLPQPRGQPDRARRTWRDLQAAVRETGADIGLAFDGDADRCFVVDERGEIVSPSRADRADRGPRAGHASPGCDGDPQPDHLAGRARDGRPSTAARPVRTRVGHSFIKATMAETDAVFGGEHSGPLLLPRLLARRLRHARRAARAGRARPRRDRPLSELLAPYARYVATGEINSTVADQAARRSPRSSRRYGGRDGVERRPPRRADRDRRRLVVQRPRVQHRAAAAAQRRGADDEATHGPRPRRRAGR